jgi:hypothetical protein
MKISEVLTKAADLIEPEGAWTQGRDAGSANGAGVALDSPKAVCWCMVGAIRKITGATLGEGPAKPALRLVRDYLGRAPIDYNDDPHRTQKEVVNTLRRVAIIALGRNE